MEAVVVLALVVFGLPIILSIIAMSKVNGLEGEVSRLKYRLRQIEREGVTASDKNKHAIKSTYGEATASSKATEKAAALASTPPKQKTQSASPWTSSKQKAAQNKASKKPKTQKPTTPKKSLEELIGAQWSVWVGGLALLVGAVFLLRYSIEAGVFTPAMRVAMAGFMGVVLLGAGEWLHRNDLKMLASGKMKSLAEGLSQHAYIPTLLTAIGVFTLFGAAYAAYALYGFLDTVPAFALLGLISVGGLALSFRHGPVLAAVGLVGAMVVPLLVQSDTPSVYALYGYLALISAVALFIAHQRKWGWLNVATLVGLLFWSMMSMKAGRVLPTAFVWFGFLAVTFIVNAFLAQNSNGASKFSSYKDLAHRPLISAIWTGFAAFLVLVVLDLARDVSAIYAMGLAFAALITAAAWVFRRNISYSLIGPALAGFILVEIGLGERSFVETLVIGIFFALSLIVFCTLRQVDLKGAFAANPLYSKSNIWAGASIVYPILFILALFGETSLEHEVVLGSTLGGFALIFAGLAIKLKDNKGGLVTPARLYAAGSAVAYLLAVLIGLDGIVKSLGIMAGIALYGAGAWYFKAQTPRVIAPAFALLSAGHSFIEPIDAGQVGDRLLFNSLWLYFALPCALCAAAAWALSRRKTDLWSEGLKALTLTFAALFVVFQIRHLMNGGNILAPRLSFDELALQVLTGLSFTLGATRLAPHQWDSKGDMHTRVLPTLAMAVSSVTLVLFALGVCFAKSPLLNEVETVRGNIALNSLTLGYLLPALALAFIARELKNRRPKAYIRILGGLAFISLILFVTGTIRFAFTGDMISVFENFPTGLELYAISAAWLVLGIALLVVGLKRNALDLRLASAVLITLTILKAFLIDMAELEGVLRALSFVVLGLILIIIGRSYQRILFSKKS